MVMKDLSIKDAMAEKGKMEGEILASIRTFENTTNLSVIGITIETDHKIPDNKTTVNSVFVSVELK